MKLYRVIDHGIVTCICIECASGEFPIESMD